MKPVKQGNSKRSSHRSNLVCFVFILNNCGETTSPQKTEPQPPPKNPIQQIDKKSESGTQTSVENAGDLVATVKPELLPLASLTLTQNDGTESICMGGFFDGDVLVTASHCMSKIDIDHCTKPLKIRWLANSNSQKVEVSNSVAFCKKIAIYSTNDKGNSVDLAVINFGGTSDLPKQHLIISPQTPEFNAGVSMQAAHQDKSVERFYGKVTEIFEPFFLNFASNFGGCSGTPLFEDLSGVNGKTDFSKKVVGIHLSASDNNSRAVSATQVSTILQKHTQLKNGAAK